MIVDSSALIALLQGEPEASRIAHAMATAPDVRLSAVNLVETAMVIESRKGRSGAAGLDWLVQRAGITIDAVDPTQAALAREAFRRFGRGNHPAGLNFGDCFAYALARHHDAPLLFKGHGR